MIHVVRYNEKLKCDWDEFSSKCKKSHFMFYRDYMDYHKARFIDHSLIFYNDNNSIVALLPANESNDEMHSHQGLSFGGFLINENATCEFVISLFDALKSYMGIHGFKKILYKCIPRIYEKIPSEEELYALFINNAELVRRDCSVAIDMGNKLEYQKRRSRSVKKGIKNGVSVVELNELSGYWDILSEVLLQKHDSQPVHTLEEITSLRNSFPENIRCFCAIYHGKIVAGTIVFTSGHVAHCQYLASNSEGRNIGALDLVLDHLINYSFVNMKYFDFGISNENNGRFLNRGLIAQKEGFGARTIVHDFYEISI
ncbi:GNAT family N-acetyltransferase [Vibrio vulnificus]|uniref:GNAT family N-acetyltransferase n=1 Tax=Vibrio vulnificus TaxID=672 RepID=UPI000D3EC58F|nr:GNAT family N-acetyltransferase [Vibrio vulnificus]MCR9502101.1 GNAT family N-acetyltransferase [Vibrio vulnificus]MDS1872896.1 GNAT family N-acetyltransferase [Vibrio vulnificus]NIG91418.1 GNAT family N-acetyltransferase [Vibrio vulnificus]PUZ79810.1 GNAT family N-acetyltransferase [Vibrio vulnificus]HAS6390165.1 GNAT family N-acetyltransferase [Vibrio vulnificus]